MIESEHKTKDGVLIKVKTEDGLISNISVGEYEILMSDLTAALEGLHDQVDKLTSFEKN